MADAPGLRELSPAQCLLALLVTGHLAADFLVQTKRVAERKARRFPVLLLHGLLTLLAHALVLLPFWNVDLLVPLLGLSAYHLLVDFTKGRLALRGGPGWRLPLFLWDQGLHGAGLVAVWFWLLDAGIQERVLILLPESWLSPVAAWGVLIAGAIANGKGGTAVVRGLLARYPDLPPRSSDREKPSGEPADAEYEMGRTIGVLERLLIYVLVLWGQWGALGLVLAAKSIARYAELHDQAFADYYLIGTLASILTAIVIGVAVRLAVLA